jgi:catechol 2,3-dioxygenase-like lactoylglutathione lyase family enzyme
VLLLLKKGASARLPVTPHDGDGELHLAFAVPSGEIGRWADWLRAKGIPIEDDRAWGRGGRSLYFRDPDRHLLEVASPGVWSVY